MMKGPDDPDDPDDRIEFKKWEREYDKFCKWEKEVEDNMTTLYNLVWGQCSDAMQQKLEGMLTYHDISANKEAIALLIAIQDTA